MTGWAATVSGRAPAAEGATTAGISTPVRLSRRVRSNTRSTTARSASTPAVCPAGSRNHCAVLQPFTVNTATEAASASQTSFFIPCYPRTDHPTDAIEPTLSALRRTCVRPAESMPAEVRSQARKPPPWSLPRPPPRGSRLRLRANASNSNRSERSHAEKMNWTDSCIAHDGASESADVLSTVGNLKVWPEQVLTADTSSPQNCRPEPPNSSRLRNWL